MPRRLTPALAATLLLAGACQRSAPDDADEADTHVRTSEPALEGEATPAPPTDVNTGDASRAAGSTLAFAAELMPALDTGDENLVFSPYSITSAMHLALLGAEGETRDAIALGLQLPPEASHHPDMHALIDALTEGDDVAMNVANRFYVEQSLEPQIDPTYRQDAAAYYGADLGLSDFRGAPNQARDEINAWVSEQTAEMIPSLLPEGSIDTRTVSVLVNAIHFLGDWAVPFEVDATRDGTFTTASGEALERPMMHRTDRMAYDESDTMQVVALPYEGREWALHIVLPREGHEAAVGEALLRDGVTPLAELGGRQVALALPRFEATWKASVRQPLIDLGMGTAFSDAADFGGLLTGGGVTISDVIHEAVIVVDERGTEAAAATGVMIRTTSMPAPPTPMIVDRPFYFMLVHEPTATPLFVGHIVSPDEARERD